MKNKHGNVIASPMTKQCGMVLLEGLIAIALLASGILGVVGLQASFMKNLGDANYRAEAGFLTDQLFGTMWADRANLGCYVRPLPSTGCGSATSKANIENWLANVNNRLPGAAASLQRISVDGDNQVIVTISWRTAQDAQLHRFVAAGHING